MVYVLKKTADDGDYQVERCHQAIIQHDSCDAGIRDPALQALGVVCRQHKGVLWRSEYEFYPQRNGNLEHTSATNRIADARLVRQVRLTKILLQELTKTSDELGVMYESYDDPQNTIQELQEQLALEDGDAEEEDP